MSQNEAYLDIVWKQFKKNKPALVALWILGGLLLIAMAAPLIGSNQPFIFYDGDKVLFPWVRALFNPPLVVDFMFNMALLAFVPWLIGAIIGNVVAKRRDVPGRRRALIAAFSFLLLTTALCLIFSVPSIRPTNKYGSRTFAQEDFDNPQQRQGVYALIPFGPQESDLDARQLPPFTRKAESLWYESNDGFMHILGTDNTGHDVLVQLIYGTRIALTVGIVAVSIYVSIGVIAGAIAGYYGGFVDALISRIVEVVLLFPSFFLILTLVALIGKSIYIIMVVIGITGWPTIARLIRGEVLKQRALEYSLSARALGVGNLRIIFRHILPNAVAPALVAIPFGIASAIVVEAGLSLLGVGLEPPTPSWGYLLQIASGNYRLWWLVVFPSLAIFLTVTILNLVGSGLRDAMDPRLRI